MPPLRDLREYIDLTEEMGLLKKIDGADWKLEIGALSDLYRRRKSTLFDSIKGYPKGYRVFTNIFASENQMRLILGIPPDVTMLECVSLLRKRLSQFKPMPPRKVKTGPILENVLTGDKVDLLKFPIPLWHELDGGRYMGTADMVITKDPDTDWTNYGTYRVMVHDKTNAASYMSPGRHGRMIREKYWSRGQSCPVAVVCGEDPTLFVPSLTSIPYGISEYEYAGWLRGEPVDVVVGPTTGLLLPASAEIVIEGEIPPPDVESREEGPFGEWTGYYASKSRKEPVIKVKAILHRNNPILTGVSSGLVPSEVRGNPIRAAVLWDQLERAGVPGITGVWYLEPGGSYFLIAISVKQAYPGHARMVGTAAAGCREGAYLSRFIIVVDDDIDPTKEDDVWWAMASRCDPATSIDLIPNCWSSPLDPRLDPEKRQKGDFSASKAIIYACKPFHWIKDYPVTVKGSTELMEKVIKKFKSQLTDTTDADLKHLASAKVVK